MNIIDSTVAALPFWENRKNWHTITMEADSLRNRFGLAQLTIEANAWRIRQFSDEEGNPPPTVSAAAVKRYCNSGQGYEGGPPAWFRQFTHELHERVNKKIVSD